MNKRYYSLFEKIEGKWIRQSTLSFTKAIAVRFFQNALLGGCLSGKHVELRVVKRSVFRPYEK